MAKLSKSFFPHDINARNDIKIVRLLDKLGYEGYGIYWTLVEIFHESGGEIEKNDIELIAKSIRIRLKLVNSVLNDFGLFSESDGKYTSDRVKSNLNLIEVKSEKARQSASYRFSQGSERIATENANAERTHSERYAINKRKEIKEINKEEEMRTHPRSTSTPFPDWKKMFLENEAWVASVAKSLSLHPARIPKLIDEFDNHLDSIKQYHPDAKEYVKHFMNWTRSSKKDGNSLPPGAVRDTTPVN